MNARAPTRMWRSCLPTRQTSVIAAMALFAFAPPALAQHTDAWVPGKSHGTVSVAYQHLYVRYHALSDGTKDLPGTIRNRSLFLNVDYGLTERLAVTVGAAYKSNRYDVRKPGAIHDPGTLADDHGEQFLDDGRYHGSWQDWSIALRYQWIDKPFLVTPFIGYGRPIRDYTTFSHAAPGTGQARLEVGVNAGGRFAAPAQNLYWQAGYGYAYMEKAGNRRVNHSTFNLELGYFLTPRLGVHAVVVAQKTYNGQEFPEDFVGKRTSDEFFHHDQNLRDDFVNVGVGVNYQFNDRYLGFANVGHTVWGENTHLIDYAITVGVSRGF